MQVADGLKELGLRHRAFGQFILFEHSQLVVRFFLEWLFLERFRFVAMKQPLAKPRIHRLAAGLVIIVVKVKTDVRESLWMPQQLIDVSDGGAFDSRRFFGPIPGGSDQYLRPRGGGGGDFHIGKFDAQPRRIFAQAPALHRMGYHDDRSLGC